MAYENWCLLFLDDKMTVVTAAWFYFGFANAERGFIKSKSYLPNALSW